jgi:hypothetical protein
MGIPKFEILAPPLLLLLLDGRQPADAYWELVPASSGWEVLTGCLEVATAWANKSSRWMDVRLASTPRQRRVHVRDNTTAAAANVKLPMTSAEKK